MGEVSQRCALPGCGAVVGSVPGRPQRKYCSAAHRVAMRRLRRSALQEAAAPSVVATLPWLREPVSAGPPISRTPDGPGFSRTSDGPGLSRSCEGSGFSRGSDGSALVRGPEAPCPAAPESVDGGAEKAAARRPRSRSAWDALVGRPRRAIGLFGATAVLVGGYLLTAASPVELPPVPAADLPSSEEQWAEHAQLALVGLTGQLDRIAEAEEAWSRAALAAPGTGTPTEVAQLRQRKLLLEQQKATLQTQLVTYRELARTSDELARAERQLAELEELMRRQPTETDPVRAAEYRRALAEQYELRRQHCEGLRERRRTLQAGVEAATRAPLPDGRRETDDVADAVVALGEGRPQRRDGGAVHERPPVVQGRDQEDGKPAESVGTSGPPDPRGPGDETGQRPRGPVERVGGTVREAGRAVGVGEGSGRAGSDAGQGGGDRTPAEARPRDTVSAVGDTAQRTLGGSRDDRGRDDAAEPRTASGGGSGRGEGSTGGSGSGGSARSVRTSGTADASRTSSPSRSAPAPTGVASAVAGPWARAAGGGAASPHVEQGLREADRRIAEESRSSRSSSDGEGSGGGGSWSPSGGGSGSDSSGSGHSSSGSDAGSWPSASSWATE